MLSYRSYTVFTTSESPIADGPRDDAHAEINHHAVAYMELTKASNSKRDFQTFSRSLAIMLFDRPYMISYWSFIIIMTVSRDIIACFPQFKDVT